MAISSCVLCYKYARLDMTQNLINIYAVYEIKTTFSEKSSASSSHHSSLFSPLLSLRLELIDGTPTLKINHGSGTVVLQLPGNINVADRRWHRLDVRSNSKVGCFTLLTPTCTH